MEAFFDNEDLSVVEDIKHSRLERRYLAAGKDKAGRWMLVSFTIRNKGGRRYLRPISARYMHAKELERHANRHQATA